MAMAVLIIFVLGVGNFAMHHAVLASGHPMLGQMPWHIRMLGGRISLAAEFVLLLGALLLAYYASPLWAWGYFGYTLLNGLGAWLILTRRM
jgi:hypothetical protein